MCLHIYSKCPEDVFANIGSDLNMYFHIYSKCPEHAFASTVSALNMYLHIQLVP